MGVVLLARGNVEVFVGVLVGVKKGIFVKAGSSWTFLSSMISTEIQLPNNRIICKDNSATFTYISV